jgi:acetyl esterase
MKDAPLRIDEHLQFWGAALLGNLPAEVQVLLSGKPPVQVEGQTLDPQIQMILALRERLGHPPMNTLPPLEARARMRRDALVHAGVPIPVRAVKDLEVDGAAGKLKARLYTPPGADGPYPLVVFYHGGGFVVCDLDTHDPACRLLCREAQVNVLSVEYRLAPEHPFPAAVEDARAALRWAFAHAAELGADPARLAVAGDSAGGNLAAVTAQAAVRDGGPAPVFQLLIYPSTDRTRDWESQERYGEGFFLTKAERLWYDAHYMTGSGAAPDDHRASPLLAPDLSGLPPALVVTAAFDPLRDEGEAYAAALEAAGNTVTLRRVPGLIHGFINMIGFSQASYAALADIARHTKAALARP